MKHALRRGAIRSHWTIALALCAAVATAALAASPAPRRAANAAHVVRSDSGVVVSDSPEASAIGAAVLSAGGNAFDAAIATSFALTVARPHSTGIGGGGFLLGYVAATREFIALDFRETAPAAATPDYYAARFAKSGEGPSPSVYGANAVATPGLVAGLHLIRRRLGTQPWDQLLQPAIALCETGFVVDESFRSAVTTIQKRYVEHPEFRTRFHVLYESLLSGGATPEVGARVPRRDLVRALQRLADFGPDDFYRGKIAEAIAATIAADGGVLTARDLAGYRVQRRVALRGAYRDFEIVTMPPPSSGGVALLEMFGVLAARPDYTTTDDAGRRHLFVEAMRHAFASRARWLGDADFADVPVQQILDPNRLRAAAAGIDPSRAAPPATLGLASPPPDDAGTSHFCIADPFGNVVSMTETINTEFGSLLVVQPFGIILNNEMDDFSADPGRPNAYGLVQGAANGIAPGKRPLSSMTPTIILRDGRPWLALGGSGGPRIISAVMNVLARVLDDGMPLDAAIDAPRVHHQWQPNEAYFDREVPDDWVRDLASRSHAVSASRKVAIVQGLMMLPNGEMLGVSDPRKGGRPAAARAAGD